MSDESKITPDIEGILGGDVPAPRRTDAAFARSVRDGVKRRRSRKLVVLPALALGTAGAAALAFVVTTPADTNDGHPSLASNTSAASVDFIDLDDDDLFALPDLDGSSDEELARLDALLDQKIEEASRRKL